MRQSRSSGMGTFALAGWLFADLLLGAMMLFFSDWRATPSPVPTSTSTPPAAEQSGPLDIPPVITAAPAAEPSPEPTPDTSTGSNVDCARAIDRDPIVVDATNLPDDQLRTDFAQDSPVALQVRAIIHNLFNIKLNERFPHAGVQPPRVGMVVTFGNTGGNFTPESNALGTRLANGIIRAIQMDHYLKGAVYQEGYLDNRLAPGQATVQFYMLVCQNS